MTTAPAPDVRLPTTRPWGTTRDGKPLRRDIEGLRAVAVLLVAVYHVSERGVSGGVDVFLFLSGYLVIGGLLRRTVRDGTLDLAAQYRRTALRLAPAAWVTVVVTATVMLVLVPAGARAGLGGHVAASALWAENWWLSQHSLAYGAASATSNPFQHFWSLSVQGQIFVVAPLLVLCAAVAARHLPRRCPDGLRRQLPTVAVAVCAAASFAYAVHAVGVDQPRAYFSTPARAWEFLAGGLLAAAVGAGLRFGPRTATVAGWLGLAGILTCGFVVDGQNAFPGPWTLWPLLSAALVVLAGVSPSRHGVGALLGRAPLARAGRYAYGFYLWHWPVLVLLLLWRGGVGPVGAVVVLVLAGALAWLTHEGVDRIVRLRPHAPQTRTRALRLGAAVTAVVVVAATVQSAAEDRALERTLLANGPADTSTHPGALTLVDPESYPTPSGHDPIPDQSAATAGLTSARGCDVLADEPDINCDLGTVRTAEGARRTVAVIGGSHSAQWLAALDHIGNVRDVRVRSYVRSRCPFVLDPLPDPWYETPAGARCLEWNALVLRELAADPPDYVLTTATRSQNGPDGEEWVPPQYVDAFRHLDAAGIPTLGLRDTALFSQAPGQCFALHPDDPDRCTVPKSEVHGPDDLPAQADLPGSVSTIDLSGYWCPDDQCPAVIGNVLVWADVAHLTTEYARSLSSVLDREIGTATGWW